MESSEIKPKDPAGPDGSVPTQYTGERCVPGCTPYRAFQEQAWKYAFAAKHVAGADVLDLGCGSGLGLELFQRSGCRSAFGVEISAQALNFDPDRYASAGVFFIQADACSMPIADKSIDVVVALEVIEHTSHPHKLLAESARVLRPGGVCICSTPNLEVSRNENPFHVQEFSIDQFERMLADAFSKVELYAQSPVSSTQLFVHRSLGKGKALASKILEATRLRNPLRRLRQRTKLTTVRMVEEKRIEADQLDPHFSIEPHDDRARQTPAYLIAVCR